MAQDGDYKNMYELLEDTNKRVKRLERHARMATIGSLLKWIVYIAIAVGSYYYIQPYIEKVAAMYNQIQNTSSDVEQLKTDASNSISELLKNFGVQ